MTQNNTNISFNYLTPSETLEDFVHMYWEHINHSDQAFNMTIFPDSFFKIIVEIQDGKLIAFFLTGLWEKEIEVVIPPRTKVYGIKFKVLAPEYIFHHEIASLLQTAKDLQPDFWGINELIKYNFNEYVRRIEQVLFARLENKTVQKNKLQLSQKLYETNGNITAEVVSNQIYWSNRQINRYLNKYLGVSLKTYLNIQKCYHAYLHIREGRFFPEEGYFDQSHFIREIKKHTGTTPSKLYKEQNVRFVQLKNIPKK